MATFPRKGPEFLSYKQRPLVCFYRVKLGGGSTIALTRTSFGKKLIPVAMVAFPRLIQWFPAPDTQFQPSLSIGHADSSLCENIRYINFGSLTLPSLISLPAPRTLAKTFVVPLGAYTGLHRVQI
jgi:hypothetical protein